jgi:hypothetical protein
MGVEIKANPGIHALVLFAESVEPDDVCTFLEELYQAPYAEFAGDPAPTTRSTLTQTLDRVQEAFPDRAFVIFPHVDSSGGAYEDLKDFAQVSVWESKRKRHHFIRHHSSSRKGPLSAIHYAESPGW